ncbi:hypothetical protein ACFVHB_37795 [Kitasatospora sp. NPDC127111]|uniref:hypothetical protein n=1 Tax=Kitasatospora sp. NPDC127111 TaxID=3345363 RepID=UPI00363C7000
MAVTEVKVRLDGVRLDARRRCGGRFEPVASVRVPEVAQVYRISPSWGEAVPCSEAERGRWEEAARAYLTTLSRALEELYRAHGGSAAGVKVDLVDGSGFWRVLGAPRWWPGWKRRAVERSERAQRAFVAEAERAAEAYRPVREELDRRVAEQREVRRQARLALEREARRRRAVLEEVAARRVWRYVVEGEETAVVRVGRAGPEPAEFSAAEPQEPLTARELEEALFAVARERGATAQFRWDEGARAVVEEECRAGQVEVTFGQWWREMTWYGWADGPFGPRPVLPNPRPTDPGSRGIGGTGGSGTGGFTGGHGYGLGFGFGGY